VLILLTSFGYIATSPLFIGVSFPSISGWFSLISPDIVRRSSYSGRQRRTMGTIVTRKRTDGANYYTGQIVIKRQGKIHREAKSFDRRQAANAWIVRREEELRKPGGLERAGKDPKLGAVIERYVRESGKKIGGTKAQVLRTILRYDIAEMKCSEISSADVVSFAKALPVLPQTVQNYLSHLGAIFRLARPAWGYPLDRQIISDALVATKGLGLTSKARSRDRRPTLAELDQLMQHFATVKARRPSSIPMQKLIAFAIFSTRRQEEIVTIRWADYEGNRVLVRDMKHPGDKLGNNTWCDLVPEASAIVNSMPKRDPRIFPFTRNAICAAFTRACRMLEIEDLHFHDLRHEGVSRLFEMGRTIPQVSAVSGHRSWKSLQRYAHLRQTGDKYDGWQWPGADL
jgi:integrase